jgi:heme exporter protein B
VALNIVLKSFVLPSRGMAIYFYSLYNPHQYLIAKVIYNTLVLILMGATLFLLLSLFSLNPVREYGYFLVAVLLASLGISVIFSFISSIVSSQHQNNVMMAILSLPLIIPILLLSLHISGKSVGAVIDLSIADEVTLLSGIILVMMGLAMLLFPNIWRS